MNTLRRKPRPRLLVAVVTVLLGAILVITPEAAPQASPPVLVRVVIESVTPLDDMDEGAFGGTGADLFARVTIEGQGFPQTRTIGGVCVGCEIEPNWHFERTVDHSTNHISVRIEIFDDDAGECCFRFGPDRVDLTRSADRDLGLIVSRLPSCKVREIPVLETGRFVPLVGPCFEELFSEGTMDDRARIRFRIEVGASPPSSPRPPPSADLSISKSDSHDPVQVGQNLTYTLTVGNLGPDMFPADVVVTDTLPPSTTFHSASAGCTHSSGTVTCGPSVFRLSRSVTIVVKPTRAEPITNSASVTSSTADPNAGNNSVSEPTTVTEQPPPPQPPPPQPPPPQPPPRPVIIDGLFINDAPIEWLAAHETLCGQRKVEFKAASITDSGRITVSGPSGTLPVEIPAGSLSRYRFFGSNCHLLILKSGAGPGPITRVVTLVDFGTSPPSEKQILSVDSVSTLPAPNVQWSQGTGDVFFIFAPVPGTSTFVAGAAEIGIYRSDNGHRLCAEPPFVPAGQLVAQATGAQPPERRPPLPPLTPNSLLIMQGGTVLATCPKP